MCVQASYYVQSDKDGRRVVVHLFNGLNTAANHGLPAMDVPLREETVPIHGIEVRFHREVPRTFHWEPAGTVLSAGREGQTTVVRVPPLAIHAMLIGEF